MTFTVDIHRHMLPDFFWQATNDGTVPYMAGRFAIIDEMRVIPGAEARATAAGTFRRLYWDTALSWGDPVLRMLRDVVGLDRVLFGSDYPYLRRDLAVSCRQHIQASREPHGRREKGHPRRHGGDADPPASHPSPQTQTRAS